MNTIKEQSGNVKFTGKIIAFFYELLKRYPPGDIEQLVMGAELCENQEVEYSNGWLAKYAENIVNRLKEQNKYKLYFLKNSDLEFIEYFSSLNEIGIFMLDNYDKFNPFFIKDLNNCYYNIGIDFHHNDENNIILSKFNRLK